MASQRNVLLIVVDQWRADFMPVLGADFLRTPNLDRLCREGVTFRNHVTTAVPCGPARASLLTGLYLMNHRQVQNWIPLDARHVRVATFAAPSADEKRHHFLARFFAVLPGWGGMAVLDRTWYGRVLVERVEGFAKPPEWKRAFREIRDFERALAFYRPLLASLGIAERFCEPSRPWAGWQIAGQARPLFLLGAPLDGEHAPGNGQMTAFMAPSRALVDAAHALALAHGGTDAGAPGLRPEYHAHYYGAYFRDPDGNKLSVVCHDPA